MNLLQSTKSISKKFVVTKWGKNNHSIRTARWRYIWYADGSEELYDHNNDPNEWKNLANIPKYLAIKKKLSRFLPEVNNDISEW